MPPARRWSTPPTSAAAATIAATASPWTRPATPMSPASPLDQLPDHQDAFQATFQGRHRRLRGEAERHGLGPGLLHLPRRQRHRQVGSGIAVDAAGNAYVTGYTTSTNFPTTRPPSRDHWRAADDAFVTKLNARARPWSTPPTSAARQRRAATGIAVDAAGNAYVTGIHHFGQLPDRPRRRPGHIRRRRRGRLRDEAESGGPALVYSTYLGGSGDDTGQRHRRGLRRQRLRHGLHRFDQLPDQPTPCRPPYGGRRSTPS